METADPVDMITTVGLALVLLFVGVVAWQGRDDIAAIVKTIFGRYFHFRWYGAQADDALPLEPPVNEEVSKVSVLSSVEKAADEGADGDGRTDGRSVRALHEAADKLQLDKTRTAIIDTLVLAGWDVEPIRKVLKGANDVLGEEIAEARQRLGVEPPPPRVVVVRDNGGPPREMVL